MNDGTDAFIQLSHNEVNQGIRLDYVSGIGKDFQLVVIELKIGKTQIQLHLMS